MDNIIILSDGNGYHVQNVLEMYNSHLTSEYDLDTYSYIRNIEEIKKILKVTYYKKSILVYALLRNEHKEFVRKFCKKHQLSSVNIFKDYDKIHSQNYSFTTYNAELDDKYFNQVDCIEFAIDNDDGKNYKKILDADIIILGVSRTGKTPLSIFLAMKGYKVINIPLFNGMEIPKELYKVSRYKIFGLINSVEKITTIRKNRIKMSNTKYTNENSIMCELNFAYTLYNNLECDIINSEDQAVEEIAHYVENKIKENL
ncbi:MAG: kinase/pyrophosphorylase [Bacilli bacterium]